MDKSGCFEWIIIDSSDDFLGRINWGLDGVKSNCFIDSYNRLWVNSDVKRDGELYCDYRCKLEHDRFSQAGHALTARIAMFMLT